MFNTASAFNINRQEKNLPLIGLGAPPKPKNIIDKYNVRGLLFENIVPYRRLKFSPEILSIEFGEPVPMLDRNGEETQCYKVETPLKQLPFIYIRDKALFDKFSQKDNNKRVFSFGLIKPTINNPNVIIKKDDCLLFYKAFVKGDGTPYIFNFVVSETGQEDNFLKTTHPRQRLNELINNANEGALIYPYGADGNDTLGWCETGKLPIIAELHLHCLQPLTNNNIKGLAAPGDVYIITDTRSKAKKELDEIKALQKYEVQKFNKEALKDIEEGDPLLFEQLKNDLKGYGDFYTVRDMRKRSKKEPGDVRTNKNLAFTKDDSRKMFNFDKSLYELTQGVKSWDLTKNLRSTEWRAVTVKHKTADNYIVSVYLFFPHTLRHDLDKPTFAGYASDVDVDININKVFNYHYYIDSENRIYRARLDGFVNKAYYKELFIQAIKNGYKQLQQRLINTKNNRLSNTPANIAEAEKLLKYYKMLYSDPSKYDLLDKAYGGNFNNIRDNVIDITDGKGVELNGLGKSANNQLYNNNEILETGGLRPTYKILPSYDHFFKAAENKDTFAGFGLNDTKKLIADICRKHYKECAAIAEHLKADTMLQSCFNLWHWMQHNIRYEYDRDGREEVRTPLRTWQDRERGVDCDCLSVFAWCVLKCMGYEPEFELVAFDGKKAFSHIFVNCGGIVVDRVWFIFNSRPPTVSRRELYKVNLLENLGQLF